jgi:predicted dehydrogenase
MNRLTRALLDAQVIGVPWLYMDVGAGSGDRIVITPWRHLKHMGGMLLDGGVHNADLMLYFLGNVRQVYAQMRLWQQTRYRPDDIGGLTGFYERWAAEMPATVQATAEDTLAAVLDFANGAVGQWTQCYAGHGQGSGLRVLYGSKGSMIPGGSRNGVPPVLHLDGVGEVKGEALLELVPDYHLDEISERLYGSERPGSYQVPFPEADRKLLAIEQHEFAESILQGKTPEVDGLVGRGAVAMCYAACESGMLNRPVTLAEVEAEETGTYEADVNAYYKI